MSFDDDISDALTDLHAECSAAATYRRGATEVAVQVTWGRTQFDELDEMMQAVTLESRDALIVDYAALLAVIAQPRPGDRIVQGSVSAEVCSLGSEPCFRYSNAARTVLRVHTKVIEE